ncbi:MAG: protein-glutamate O-methyltransferase CheR [Myxococcota bacterium]
MTELPEDEVCTLLTTIRNTYHYDFTGYAQASLRRRLRTGLTKLGCPDLAALQRRITADPAAFQELLGVLTVHVSDLFRDPSYHRFLRQEVCPRLATWPSLKLWVAGCSTGEEAWSLAILLAETDLLSRSLIYATDIDPVALRQAEDGVYDIDRLPRFSQNYREAGGSGSLSDWYAAHYGRARFDDRLRRRMVFADHDLATDAVFSEVQFVSCRNVLIYFDRGLQDRAVGLFAEALCRGGVLGIGSKETLHFSSHNHAFELLSHEERVYRRR